MIHELYSNSLTRFSKENMSLRVILYGNRVCNGTVTLAQKTIPAGHFGGGRAYGIATDNFAVETDSLYSVIFTRARYGLRL